MKSIRNFWNSPLEKLVNEKFSEETMTLQLRYSSRYKYKLQYNSKIMTKCHTIIITQLKNIYWVYLSGLIAIKIRQNYGLQNYDEILKSKFCLETLNCEWYYAFKCYYLYCIWWHEQALVRLGQHMLFSFLFALFCFAFQLEKKILLINLILFIYLSIYLLIYFYT